MTRERKDRLPSKVPRKQQALVRLGIDPEELERAAPISDILGEYAKPETAALNLRAATSWIDKDRGNSAIAARAFLKFWDEIPKGDRIRLSLEAVCVGAGVATTDLLGCLVMALRDRKVQQATLKLVLGQPDVMDATIYSATTPGKQGAADRKMIHSMPIIGFLPGPQGSQFQVNLGVLNAPQPQARNDDDDRELSVNDVFPPITDVLEGWNTSRRNLLKAPDDV